MENQRNSLPDKQRKSRSITFRISASMYEKIQRKSKTKNQSMSETLTAMLEEGLKRNMKHEKEIAAFLIETQQLANDFERDLSADEKEKFDSFMKEVSERWDS